MSGGRGGVVLEAVDLVKHFPVKHGLFQPARHVHALDGVSFALKRGETLAIVGESGCGKSTLAKCLMRLTEPTGGRVVLLGDDITHLGQGALRGLRRHMQIVFQDPYASLNPRWSIGSIVGDPIRLHEKVPAAERRRRVAELLETVGLDPGFADRHPHELSGGQRQRVAIARALAVNPSVIICDEPVSALDVSIQAQVINLLKRLQAKLGIAYLFISHNLALVEHISDRIAVMYLGQVVELADTRSMRRELLHPYSKALFSAAPVADPDASARRTRIILAGDVPSPVDPPGGCRFRTRCPWKQARCADESPALRAVGDRLVRCHFAGEPGFPAPLS
ncbi:MAG: dipeptide ABC transporter ATP-binding protein [Betaproteobacteria bacterium]|nr:dipeptide ABC transporter ATP-binding protein [Betaproteobacteria bacterium]